MGAVGKTEPARIRGERGHGVSDPFPRLQNKGYLEVEKRLSPLGPARKYYFLTEQGNEYLRGRFKKLGRRSVGSWML